ncbi:uncharacterized protein LOC119553168 [Drosophila subpulchrella]|uniref:uncharacterized protein LOC119553168 n=1 Tax=Drosophila subpulchrella TaxID=1486046 RepID=UPI0018A1A5D4|nr:uncharacterized protein LOC119553168 [Drosophila subpulchrella]
MDLHYAILCCLFMIWLHTICLYKIFLRSYVCLSKKPADKGNCYEGLFPVPDEMENCTEGVWDFLREPEKDFNDSEDQKVEMLGEVDSSDEISDSSERSEMEYEVSKEHKMAEKDFNVSIDRKAARLDEVDSSDEISDSLEELEEDYEVPKEYNLVVKKMETLVQIKNIQLDTMEEKNIPKSFEDRFNASRQKILCRSRRQKRSLFNFFSSTFLY